MNVPSPWELAGERAAEALDGVHAVLIIGEDAEATAEAALGIARVQAHRRRVAVADLFGELPTFERLLSAPAEHGLVDSFVYGVSLNQIARPVGSAENLFILPSGAGPIDHETVLGSSRWQRLAGGFREVGALLLAAVPANAPALERLLSSFDGYVAVGALQVAPEHALIRQIDLPPVAAAKTGAPPSIEAPYADTRAATSAPFAHGRPDRRQLTQIIGAAAALLVLAAVGALLLYPMTSNEPLPATEAVAMQANTAVEDAGTAEPTDTLPAVTVANPADSATSAGYSVQLASHTGQTSALGHVETAAERAVPAITYSPVITGAANARWYRVLAGAFPDRGAADSLLAQLRRRGSLSAEQGEVRYAPYAILLERSVTREQTASHLREYRTRGIPAYGLMQVDGTVNLYAGAFETPEQASLLLATLRERGEEPQVVYRLGRVF